MSDVGDVDAPLVVVAHSLGSVIASDYVWDAQHPETGRAQGANPFERMETLAGLVTFGSTLPLFTLALPRVVAIAPPRTSPGLPDAVRAVARWDNYYDPDDVLGWPLQPLSEGYRLLVEDRAINAGRGVFDLIVRSWNPLSHEIYWRDAEVIKAIAQMLTQLMR